MQELYDYIVAEATKIFDLMAKRQGVKAQTRNVKSAFGARIKASSHEAELDVIINEASVMIHLDSGVMSFKEPYYVECKTKEEFNKEIPKIEEFVNDCFTLKLLKKI